MATKPPSHRMQGLLGEFKKLYEGRLAKLKDKNVDLASTYTSEDNVMPKAVITNYEVNIRCGETKHMAVSEYELR